MIVRNDIPNDATILGSSTNPYSSFPILIECAVSDYPVVPSNKIHSSPFGDSYTATGQFKEFRFVDEYSLRSLLDRAVNHCAVVGINEIECWISGLVNSDILNGTFSDILKDDPIVLSCDETGIYESMGDIDKLDCSTSAGVLQ